MTKTKEESTMPIPPRHAIHDAVSNIEDLLRVIRRQTERGDRMTQINNGGPAFPVTDFVVDSKAGMSLRDWFAGHCPPMPEQWFLDSPKGTHWGEAYAAWAYFYADAMIAERAKQ